MRNALFKLEVQLERMLLTGIFILSRILNQKKLMEFVMKAILLNQKVNMTIIAHIYNIGEVIALKFCYYKN